MANENEVKFAGTVIEVDDIVVAKVTSFNKNVAVSEDNITGSEDVIPGTDVLHEQFCSIAVSETAAVEGIVIELTSTGRDIGQSELKDAAESGKTVVMKQTKNNGYGQSIRGFFTSYEETGDVSKVYRFKANFRVNEKTEILPGS